jgi:hypothetical protein
MSLKSNYILIKYNSAIKTVPGDIIIIGSTALGGPWPPLANVASDFYPAQPSTSF